MQSDLDTMSKHELQSLRNFLYKACSFGATVTEAYLERIHCVNEKLASLS